MPRIRIVLLALAAVLAFGADGPAFPPEVAAALDRISPESLRGHVSFLASDLLQGRDTPSPGLDIAAEYIAAQFRRAGLEPAGDDGYFQTAKFVHSTPDMTGFELLLEAGGRKVFAGPAGVSVDNSSALRLTRAPLFKISVKPGDAAPQLTPAQIKGKVVVLSFMPYDASGVSVFFRLQRMQPAAVIVVGNRWGSARLRDAAEFVVPRISVRNRVFSKACDALPGGDTGAVISIRLAAPKTRPVTLRNVAGLLPGSDPVLKAEFVLVTAHYDHNGVRAAGEGDRIFNGANDDASGTASVIEVASALAATEHRPKRGILFLTFFGEERGLLGSSYYIRHPLRPLANTVAGINLELLGRTDDNEGPQIGRASVTGFDYSDIGGTLRRAGELTGVEVVHHPRNSDQYFGLSDNISLARAGIPAHTVAVSFMFPDYHKPADEWQKLDYGNMAKVNRMIAAGVVLIADAPERPRWNPANPKVERLLKRIEEIDPVTDANRDP